MHEEGHDARTPPLCRGVFDPSRLHVLLLAAPYGIEIKLPQDDFGRRGLCFLSERHHLRISATFGRFWARGPASAEPFNSRGRFALTDASKGMSRGAIC